jgi:hypothetical protein
MNTEAHQLTDSDLNSVTGGMNLEGVRESTNVIDSRGGSSAVGAYIVHYDINGKVSGYSNRY